MSVLRPPYAGSFCSTDWKYSFARILVSHFSVFSLLDRVCVLTRGTVTALGAEISPDGPSGSILTSAHKVLNDLFQSKQVGRKG